MASNATALVAGSLDLAPALPQDTTNGVTALGTLDAPEFPEYLTNNPLPDGRPWGLRSAEGTNQYKDRPTSGVTRRYEFTVKRGKKAPDGYLRDVLLVNDQYPGPTIEANWGDMIEVKVNNQITGPEEGTAMHWHGLLQNETPWYDGTPSVHQCPIAPGKSFTYRFKADLYGTSWWHSHYSAQYAGGLHGAMIIHGPSHVPYDRDLGPVFINDWDHREYFDIVKDVMSTEGNNFPPTIIIPQSDNNLINGKGNFNCSSIRDTDPTPCTNNAGLAKFRFRSGRTHRLRLINSGSEGLQRFSIDEHTMTVIANDFVPVVPYDTKVVTLGIGQRTDVIVRGTGRPRRAYWMRSLMPKDTVCAQTKNPLALAVVLYEDADRNAKPNTVAWPAEPGVDPCDNDDLSKTVPVFPIRPNPNPEVTQVIDVEARRNETNHFNWFMNGQTFRANFNNPLLLLAHQGNTSYPDNPEWNVYNFRSNKTMRFIINNKGAAAHPMHIHGHNMYILAVGKGEWDGRITNPNNPQRRDVQQMPGFGYMVFQIDADNPGVWPFHCHIAWHVSQGLYINIMERPDDIKQMEIPSIMAQTCVDWDEYSKNNVVDQIDSGLRLAKEKA